MKWLLHIDIDTDDEDGGYDKAGILDQIDRDLNRGEGLYACVEGAVLEKVPEEGGVETFMRGLAGGSLG